MIPFASQRELGQDLATHLLNERDNEMMEVAQVRGAVVQDLHGAFAEWELYAHSMTRCINYLYSMSINPDPAQGTLTREQYFDYIDRVEEKLGLSGQPRAVVFHTKHERAHCHVVWSRIDTDNKKAIHMAFDREKLMMVTREFARDHGLELAAGYNKDKDRTNQPSQLSLYDQFQQVATGLTREDRSTHVTNAWRQSDSPKAFVQALSDLGYILATGKRPYVLVDFYGHTNSLPKLISGKDVRIKDIRAYLEKDFPAHSLPDVEKAKELASTYRMTSESFFKAQVMEGKITALKEQQATRWQKVEDRQLSLSGRQKQELNSLQQEHGKVRADLRSSSLAEAKRIREERNSHKPIGLAAFLGRVTGVQLVIKKVRKHQDKKRFEAFKQEKAGLNERQKRQRKEQLLRHKLQSRDMARYVRALNQIDRRELKSLETELVKDRRMRSRSGDSHMPALSMDFKTDRQAEQDQDNRAYVLAQAKEHAEFDGEPFVEPDGIDLVDEFSRAANAEHSDDDGGDGDDTGPLRAFEPTIRRKKLQKKRDQDRER